MLEVKEKIIAGAIAIIIVIVVAIACIGQLAKYSEAGKETMNINNAIIQINQLKSIVEIESNQIVPSSDNAALLNQYVSSAAEYANENLNNTNTERYAKMVSNITNSLNGYQNQTQIERGEVLQSMNSDLNTLYGYRSETHVTYGINGIIIILGALGLIAEAVYLYIKYKKNA